MPTNKEFSTAVVGCVTALAESFNRAVTERTFAAYEIGLEGLSPEEIKEATKIVLKSSRFMPSPAEIREALQFKLEDRSVRAWLVFSRTVETHGAIRSVNFDDTVVNATVRALGGWEFVCDLPITEFDVFLKKRFQDTYCSLCRTGIPADDAAPLLGWADRENFKNGFSICQPLKIETGLPPIARIRGPLIDNRPEDIPRLELKTV